MSLEVTAGERPVHFPENPERFGFDAEVSRIFPDMAGRSIPNFYDSHWEHAKMVRSFVEHKSEITVLDIGASRGALLTAMKREFADIWERVKYKAVDNSPDMCAYLLKDYPDVDVVCLDITSDKFLNSVEQYDVVCANYVLQFIPQYMQDRVLKKVFAKVKKGGVLIFGHKSRHYGPLGAAAHEQYIRWRMRNGYTREEIEAKTRALAGSMYPQDHEVVMGSANAHFSYVQETFRYMMFSTFLAVK